VGISETEHLAFPKSVAYTSSVPTNLKRYHGDQHLHFVTFHTNKSTLPSMKKRQRI
jgi:hypothetical protein